MTPKNQIRKKLPKAVRIAFIGIIVILFATWRTQAQSSVYSQPSIYKGFEAAFGMRTFRLNSDIPELNGLNVAEEGGSFGVLFGNDLFRTKLRIAGFYNSTDKVRRTVNIFESEGLVNFYPLQLANNIETRVEPYLLGGITLDHLKFLGYYLHETENPQVNYSDSREPLLGKITQATASLGIGAEWRIVNSYEFIHLFGEVKYAQPLYKKASRQVFENTRIESYMSVNVGVSFGIYR